MHKYAAQAKMSQHSKDIHVKGAIRLVLRAYAMYIEFANKERTKPLIYHRGLVWIVFRLVHGGIVDSLGNAFKLLIGLANELEVIFQRNESTLLLNKLETQKSSFSNLCIQDLMLRVQAALDVMYPLLSRKLKDLGLPVQYYIGSKFLAFFSDSTFPSQHVYLLWDLSIFYSAVQSDKCVYGNVLLVGIALFFFQNALKTVGEKNLHKIQSPQELKYLIDNPLVLSLNLMNLPTFSDRVTSLYESLFPSNIITSFLSRAAQIERRYDELHAAYRRQFSKYFFHNEATLSQINLTPHNPKTEPLSPKDYVTIEKVTRALKMEYVKHAKIKVKVIDYAIVKRNIEEAFQQVLRSNCKFILGVAYGGDSREKLFEIPEDGKERACASYDAKYEPGAVLSLRLYCSGFTGSTYDEQPSAQRVIHSPMKNTQLRMLHSTVTREVEAAERQGLLDSLRCMEFSARLKYMLATCEISLDSVETNLFYKGWEAMRWVAGEAEQRKAKEKLLLALPPSPQIQIAVLSYQAHKEIKEQPGLKLQRSLQCNLPQISNFIDPQFQNEEELIESMMISQQQAVRDMIDQQADWIMNQNYPIIMPPYRPISLKINQKSTFATQSSRSLPRDVPLTLQDIDPFQQAFTPEDLDFLEQRYVGGENLEPLIQALGHQGPNYEQNRKYWNKLKEYIQLKWKKEEIAPSRLIPLSLKELASIILLRTQFSFLKLGQKLLQLIRITNRQSESIKYEQACGFVEELCRRLMVPIPGFQLQNWIQSALFTHFPQIIKATIISHHQVTSSDVDVTSLLQRYLNFCHQRVASKVLFLNGLATLAEFKSAISKIKLPRLLVLTFSTIRGQIATQAFVIDSNGHIKPKQSVQDCMIWNSYFSLQAPRESLTSLRSLLSLPFLSDWLRIEVSLSSVKMKPRLCKFSLEVRVERADKSFTFTRGVKRVLELPQAVRIIEYQNVQHVQNKQELGELHQYDTLSDIRYRIRRYFHHSMDIEQLKEMESYVFTDENMIEISEFTPLGKMFQEGGKIQLLFNYRHERFDKEREQIEQHNAYALFINGDGTSAFKRCRVERIKGRRVGEQQLYRVFYQNKVELRTRKEIILQEYDRRSA